MGEAPAPLSAELRRGWLRVDDPLLAGRYREALAALGLAPPLPAIFHLDAAGFSPELALALGDAFYLGRAPLEGHAVILGSEQLAAPLVHPGLGFAAAALRALFGASRREIAALTLREPLVVDVRSDAAPIAGPSDLADAGAVELRVRTPGGLVEGALRLEAFKREFLESDRLWLDDDSIHQMAALAARVRGLPALPEGFAVSRHPLALFFSPAFGGSYVLEEPGASAPTATTCVLSAEPFAVGAGLEPGASARGRRVELRRLDAAGALEVLLRHDLATLDLAALRAGRAALERALDWIATDALLAKDPEAVLAAPGARPTARSLRDVGAPAEYLELEELARRLRSADGIIDVEELAPANRLRLLAPTSTRSKVRRFVRHLQAFLDPTDLGRAWCFAPDAFFARWVGLPALRRERFARWFAAHEDALRDEAAADGAQA